MLTNKNKEKMQNSEKANACRLLRRKVCISVKNLSFDSASQHRAPTAVFFVSLPLWTPSLSDVPAADWTRIVRPIGVLTAL